MNQPSLTEALEPDIVEKAGVVGVREDTRRLAAVAAQARPGRALDMGTGTGYVGIYLALRGWEVDATDISPRALALARENARRNHVTMRVFYSDRFAAVEGRYDVIAFNPPMRPTETELTRFITSLLRRSPTISKLLMRLSHHRLAQQRLAFLLEFAREALGHLREGGRLLLIIGKEEADALQKGLGEWKLVAYEPIETIPGIGVAVFQAV